MMQPHSWKHGVKGCLPPKSTTQTIAVVAHGLPLGMHGWGFVFSELLGSLPQERLALVGFAERRWDERVYVPLLPRLPTRRLESMAAAVAMRVERHATPAILPRLFPNIRCIIATLDPTLGIATAWAKATGAELWVYAIDIHTKDFWGAGGFMHSSLQLWQREALAMAHRRFALSERMADWMRSEGAPDPIGILPPLNSVGPTPSPLPAGRRSLLFSGWVYSVHAKPLQWIERAVKDLNLDIELRLLTPMSRTDLGALGLDPERWTISRVEPHKVTAEIVRATCTLVALDPMPASRRLDLQVAWPSKLRDYLSVGRPVLCVAARDYQCASMAEAGGWGLVASNEQETREAVRRLAEASDEELGALSRAAHRFALERMNNATIGARFREQALACP